MAANMEAFENPAQPPGLSVGSPGLTPEDRADVEGALGGNEDAFARLVERYKDEVARQMWRFTRDSVLREELVQEVFVEAYLSLGKFRRTAPFGAWLRTIACRAGYRFWKRLGNERFVPLMDWDGAARQERNGQERAAEILFKLLSLLKPEERLILTLYYYEDIPLDEIARRMGWNGAVVKMRAHRARRKLRGFIEKNNLLEDLSWTD